METQNVIIYRSQLEKDMYDGLYWIFGNYGMWILGFLVGLIIAYYITQYFGRRKKKN